MRQSPKFSRVRLCGSMMKITTFTVILIVGVGAGFCTDGDKRPFDDSYHGDESTSLLHNLSTKQRKHVKKELLHLLGLDHTPKPNTSEAEASASKYMIDLYRNILLQDDHNDDVTLSTNLRGSDDSRNKLLLPRLVDKQLESADTVTSFVNQALTERQKGRKGWVMECRFDLSQVASTDVVIGAFLRIYKSSKPRSPMEKFRIELHRLETGPNGRIRRTNKPEERITVLSNKNGWVDINVTRLTSEWMQFPTKNEGIQLIVYNSTGEIVDPSSIGIVGSDGAADKQIFLVAFFKNNPDQTIVRRRRSADSSSSSSSRRTNRQHHHHQQKQQQDEDEEYGIQNDDHQVSYRNYKQDRKCQIRTLKVSFKDLKWQDWIIAPEGYAAYYCDGDCVSPLHAHNATNHAIVQTMAYLMNPATVPKPCCAPTKLSALSVLYFDDNSNVILKKYRNMVVRACGCH